MGYEQQQTTKHACPRAPDVYTVSTLVGGCPGWNNLAQDMLLASMVLAATPYNRSTPVAYGYDVVEYFSLKPSGTGVRGSPDFRADVLATDKSTALNKMLDTNYTFWFKDEANRDTFVANPRKYAPRWGGF